MAAPATLTLDALLRLCAAAAPAPWYPSRYAQETGADRDGLDEPLSRLRLAGLVRLTDWEAGKGQGYALTDAGRAVLDSPRALARLRAGDVPAAAPTANRRPAGPLTTWERGEAVRAALLAPGSTPVTWLLIAAQIVAFIGAMYFALQRHIALAAFLSNGSSPIRDRLAVWGPALAAGEWWRLISYAFVHGGAVHLLLNLLSHAALGPVVERMFGSVRLLILWLVSALGGGCAVVLAGQAAVGSSGAVCGMLGAMVAFVALNRRHLGPQLVAMWQRGLASAVIATVFISMVPGVSWSGHLGGAVAGLAAGVLLNYQRFGTAWQRWASVLGPVLLTAGCVAAAYFSPAVADSRAKFARVTEQQQIALEERQTRQHEVADFDKQVASEVNRVMALTYKVCFEHADPLLRMEPRLRDGDQVRAAIAELDVLADELDAAKRQVAGAGPYQTTALKEAHHVADELIGEQLRLVALCRQYLLAGAADDRRRLDAFRHLDIAVRRWRALFSRPPSVTPAPRPSALIRA
jgi:membrane associated rhomboid family serine protease